MPASELAEREKRSAASTSLIAAFGLTGFKIAVGLVTGSLGILAEAAHSGLDLVTAAVTYAAIRAASKPADKEHLYGHGKIENLSALFETVLLLGTCAWIITAAVRRLAGGSAEIEVTFWSFAVMLASILVDMSRSRVLSRAASRYNSQALEADALHFSADVWSSAVVILGLICVKAGQRWTAVPWLRNADAVAALGVALIVIFVSSKLGIRTVHALIDAAPLGVEERIIAAVEAIPGVNNCHHVRVRNSGPRLFADIHILVDGDLPLREAHSLTETIEAAIGRILPDADVTVHPEPSDEHPSIAR
jgi:cation diffusion facilitator family transporter